MVRHRRLGREHFDPDACPSDVVLNTTTHITNPVSTNTRERFINFIIKKKD